MAHWNPPVRHYLAKPSPARVLSSSDRPALSAKPHLDRIPAQGPVILGWPDSVGPNSVGLTLSLSEEFPGAVRFLTPLRLRMKP